MVVNVLGSILFKSHKLLVQVAATGTVGFVAWRHTLAARMAEKHGDDHPLVLIAVDASVQAEKAVDWYLNHIHLKQNKLLILHVAEPPIVAAQQGVYMTADVWEGMIEKSKEEAKRVEEKYAERLRSSQISGTIRAMFHSRPGEAIVDVSEKDKVAFIVMGTRGLGTIRRTIMGSVSTYVVHHAHCPVIVCPYDEPTASK